MLCYVRGYGDHVRGMVLAGMKVFVVGYIDLDNETSSEGLQ